MTKRRNIVNLGRENNPPKIYEKKGKAIDMEKYGIEIGNCIYENRLSCQEELSGFVLEGDARMTFPNGRLCLENGMDPSNGQKANYVLWCPEEFPSDVLIEWEFLPVREPGLAMLFFAAKGKDGRDLFDESLQRRTGEYVQYHHGDINAFHVSYFRRKEPEERAFHTCNLRKSYGFYLVAQGADPIPDADEALRPYTMAVLKKGNKIRFFVDGLEIFTFEDDGNTYGPLLSGGRIGFRQLAPMVGEYENLKVYEL